MSTNAALNVARVREQANQARRRHTQRRHTQTKNKPAHFVSRKESRNYPRRCQKQPAKVEQGHGANIKGQGPNADMCMLPLSKQTSVSFLNSLFADTGTCLRVGHQSKMRGNITAVVGCEVLCKRFGLVRGGLWLDLPFLLLPVDCADTFCLYRQTESWQFFLY